MIDKAKAFMNQHPDLKTFVEKVGKDNIGMLAAFVSWSVLTSIIPIVVGLMAISSLFLRDPHAQSVVISHLAQAMRGAFSKAELQQIVRTSTQHAGLLGLIGLLGTFWGASNIGGSLSTAFQAVFEVHGRPFIKEKLIDIGMLFVFTALMFVIIGGTLAGAILNQLFSGFPIPGVAQWIIGTVISLLSAFLLFCAIYLVFPHINPPFKFQNIWRGALLSAILFWLLSYMWPIYAHYAHFGRFGKLVTPILLLTAWIYLFAMITVIGAELVAFASIRDAQEHGRSVGPEPQENVPQHSVLRDDDPPQDGKVSESAGSQRRQAS